MISVGVIGHAGRMGSAACRAIESADDLRLAARVGRGDELDLLTEGGAEVAVEFTTPDSVKQNVLWCLDHAIHAVVGTSGLGADDLDEIGARAKDKSVNVFVAPNFALGGVLMMRFAQQAARHYDSAEIIERHHERKLDAPSGTALRTAELMDEAHSGNWTGERGKESIPGSRGAERAGIHIHSLRLPGSVAHQEVIFGGAGETLMIRHDSLDRSSFMPGVLMGIRAVGSLDGLVVGLENLL